MTTQCTPEQLEFQSFGRRRVTGRFDGGRLTSDGGGLLLREVEQRLNVLSRLAGCFTDYRHTGMVEHPVESMLAQRIYALALGYEDINDHDTLRRDSLAKNDRLEKAITKALRKSRRYLQTGRASRRFRELRYRTRQSWSRTRRVVAKAEYLAKGPNPRFVVTNLDAKTAGAQCLYEELYCRPPPSQQPHHNGAPAVAGHLRPGNGAALPNRRSTPGGPPRLPD